MPPAATARRSAWRTFPCGAHRPSSVLPRLHRFLSRCVSAGVFSAGVSLLRERESVPPVPERRPITAQPRGTGAEWVSAGPCGDGWASLRP